jgi:hypothetical protein
VGALKRMAEQARESMTARERVDHCLSAPDLHDVPTESLIQLMNVLECEYVNRMAMTYGYIHEEPDFVAV